MVTHTFAELLLPEAERLCDLTGIQLDLESAKDFAARLIQHVESKNHDGLVLDALTVAAIVRHNRPFVTCVRRRLRAEVLSLLDDDQRMAHETLRAWRDKHIAHSVNSFEEGQPVARFCLERVREEGIYGVECNYSRVLSFGTQLARTLIDLADIYLAYVASEVAREKAKLLVRAREIPVDDLLDPSRQSGIGFGRRAIDKARKFLWR